ncbi:hypothetical protein MTO96_005970 [Rhipicephalus appendiculatus]
MVSFAREHNAHPKLAYEQLDITEDVSVLLEKYGPFDRLYAFNSLNRVKNQAAAWRNMQTLLKPGGECLLFYCAWYMTPEIWRALGQKGSLVQVFRALGKLDTHYTGYAKYPGKTELRAIISGGNWI